MSIASFDFWFFFPIYFVLYWLIPSKCFFVKKSFLLFTSMIMYMLWKPIYLLVIAIVCIVTYLGGRIADKNNENRSTYLLFILLLLAFTPLFVFKYQDFVSSLINNLSQKRGLSWAIPGLNLAIPMGISFYTFQSVGYVLDVWRGKISSEKNFWDYSLFVSFFPQIMCGPISKGEELIPQLKNPGQFDKSLAFYGFHTLIWGFFMKFVIADRFGLFVDAIFSSPDSYSGANVLLATFLYSFQIYGDFAGYSLMAVGIAALLGIKLVNNFNRPYLALSVTDFWRRWHISLTRWLRDNIYIPLGGNRRGVFRTYLNIIITFLVSGIWHGAAITYIIWGVLHGVIQSMEKMLRVNKTRQSINNIERGIRVITTFVLVSLLWIFFRAPSMSSAMGIFNRIFTSFGNLNISFLGSDYVYTLIIVLPILLLKDFFSEIGVSEKGIFAKEYFHWAFSLFILVIVLSFGVLDNTQFIYSGF